ncbi:MAG: hypothetical protein K6A74_03595 [Lachnospiraceae bacterium]|nr:hypothetical protein [Lachnospiraceae bacterium]
MESKAFNKTVLLILGSLILITTVFMVVIDPYFHYHTGLSGLGYPMQKEFYQNAGVARNYNYDILIAGDSETQNIKTSKVESLWGGTAVKLPNPGAPFNETDMVVRTALKKNPDLKLVIRPLDGYYIPTDPYTMRYAGSDLYLYDDNIFNDVRYVLEKETIVDAITVLTYTRAGKSTISFDEYSNVEASEIYGNYDNLRIMLEETVDYGFGEPEEVIYERAKTNVCENIKKTALEYPDVEFIYFMPPYSAAYWKRLQNSGLTEVALNCERIALEEIAGVGNIRVFSFEDRYEVTNDWHHYSDSIHFDGGVDDAMFELIYKGEHEIKAEDIDDYILRLKDHYAGFDYDSLFLSED